MYLAKKHPRNLALWRKALLRHIRDQFPRNREPILTAEDNRRQAVTGEKFAQKENAGYSTC
jgi:hypothetical protein